MHNMPAQPRGDGRRRSLLLLLPLALISSVLVGLSFTSCRLAQPRGYTVQLNDAAARGNKIDDVIVWPVSAPPELLEPAAAEAFTKYFRQYLIQKQYSVLAGDYVRGSSGPAEASARAAVKKLDADAALVVTVRDWDERGFDTVGSLAVLIDFKLVNAGGDLWSGKMKGLEEVIRPGDNPRNLAERRDLALRRIAARLVDRLPVHVLRRP